MASIQKRITKEGRTAYRALIRIKGYPTRSATFVRRSDARRWSQEQEVDLRSTSSTCSINNGVWSRVLIIIHYITIVGLQKTRFFSIFPILITIPVLVHTIISKKWGTPFRCVFVQRSQDNLYWVIAVFNL